MCVLLMEGVLRFMNDSKLFWLVIRDWAVGRPVGRNDFLLGCRETGQQRQTDRDSGGQHHDPHCYQRVMPGMYF